MNRGLFLIAFAFLCAKSFALEERHICGKFYYVPQSIFDRGQIFTKNDQLLICGSAETPGWEEVPENQSLFHIRARLNAEGFFDPKITKDGDRYLIDPGEATEVKNVIFRNEPIGFRDRIFRGFKNQTLDPAALDNAKTWTTSRLRSMGYPCPEVQVRGAYETGTIEVDIDSGPRLILSHVERPQTGELRDTVFERFDAFQIGDRFNADLLALTSRRLLEAGIVDFTHFEDQCSQEGAIAHQRAILGQRRNLVFAIGASTEELPILRAEWRNVRLDPYASTLAFSVYTSPRLQSIKASSELYWFRKLPRLFLSPVAEIRRESEFTYKALRQRFQLGSGYIKDDSQHRYIFNFAPIYTVENTIEGQGPSHFQYLSFRGSAELLSHYFEFLRFNPQEGYQLQAHWEAQRQGAGSPFSADLIKLSGTHLWNIGSLDPPLTVLGVRFGHSIIAASNLNLIPASFRLFLGGAEDVRGFFRQSINNANLGFQTTSFLGLEARFLEVLPYQLQPFVFYDIGKVGFNEWSWINETYTAPGVGMRWQSPFGALRGTLAKGIILNENPQRPQPPEEWNIFLSYGREF